jgi:uncharacterized membrane protein
MAADWRQGPLKRGHEERGQDLPDPPDSQSRTHAVLAYALAGFSGVVLLSLKREDRFVQFHALQSVGLTVLSLAAGLSLWLLSFFPILGFLYGMLLRIFQFGLFLLWLFLLWQAYQGRWYRVPYVGAWVARQIS